MKKKLLIVALVLVVILAGLSVYVVKSGLFGIWAWSQNVAFPVYVDVVEFNKYSDDFQILADLVVREAANRKYPENTCLGFSNSDPNNLTLINLDDFEDVLLLTEREQQSLERVDQSFRDAGGEFSVIRIYEDRLEFEVDNYNFAVVYSFDGSKPEYVPSEFETDPKAKIKKLKKDWYTISVN